MVLENNYFDRFIFFFFFSFLQYYEKKKIQERKTKFISLRNELREAIGSESSSPNYLGSIHSTASLNMAGGGGSNGTEQRVSYMNTQNLYESSLSEELSMFDFAGGSSSSKPGLLSIDGTGSQQQEQQQQSQLNAHIRRKVSGVSLHHDSAEAAAVAAAVEIELDELNQHESMSTLVELIHSLVSNRVTPIYERGQTPVELPPWMSFMQRKLIDPSTSENLKLFVARVILNAQQVFKPYARFWYAPLIGFMLNSGVISRLAEIDYFTLDLCVLLLSWHKQTPPQLTERKLISRLFEQLMRRCYHDNRAILKNNLELLKTMSECWRDMIDVPVGVIYSLLTSGEQKKISVGIQLYGIVLSNGIEAYEYPADVSSVDLHKALMKCMKENAKSIHAPSAEVAGMILSRLHKQQAKRENSKVAASASTAATATAVDDDDDTLKQTLDYMFELIRSFDDSSFITSIHRIQLNYSPIAERFMNKLVHFLPSLYGNLFNFVSFLFYFFYFVF
jgi:DNA-dependent protein kinase catalytic subunit